jgi:hypothetical protein
VPAANKLKAIAVSGQPEIGDYDVGRRFGHRHELQGTLDIAD